jgi:hypothetical protein
VDRTFEGYRWLLARRLERLGRPRSGEAARRWLGRGARRAAPSRLAALDQSWRSAAACLVRRGWKPPREGPERLLCDESLGRLARWLRAAGCAAEWRRLPGGALVPEALATGAALLTSDARVLERRVVRRGQLAALWVPVQRPAAEQLALAFEELGLRRGEPRCMRCGGALEAVPKAAVAQRIPPRTARWLDAYEVCRGCGGLFWRGTHWPRIAARLPS